MPLRRIVGSCNHTCAFVLLCCCAFRWDSFVPCNAGASPTPLTCLSRLLAPNDRGPSSMLRLRGGVGAPAEVGARGYDDTPARWHYGKPEVQDKEEKASRHIIVPDTCSTLAEAVKKFKNNQHSVTFRGGDYRWDGLMSLPNSRNITADFIGEKGSRLLGRWLLPACPVFETSAQGSFRSLTCAYATDDYLEGGGFPDPDSNETLSMPHALLLVLGGPWQLETCELRAASAEVVVTLLHAQTHVTNCQVGGMGTLVQLNGTMAACSGVHCGGESRTSLDQSTVEMCGGWGGGGVRAVESAEVVATKTLFATSSVGVCINDGARVLLERCEFKGVDVTHLFAGENASFAAMRLINNVHHEGAEQYQGQQWIASERPGRLEEEGTEVVAGFSKSAGADGKKEFDWEENPDIPEEEWETHPDLIRLDRLGELDDEAQEEDMPFSLL